MYDNKSKEVDWSKYKQFTPKEFQCKHTGRHGMDPEFLDMLQELRNRFGKPIIINSGYRHHTHPDEAKKGHRNGEHTKGRCADLRVTNSQDRYQLLKLAFEMGFPRVGFHKSFLHIGIGGEGLPYDVCWDY